jgi:hypothetical protein
MTARPRASSELSVQFLRRNGAIGEYLVGLLDHLGKLLRCLVIKLVTSKYKNATARGHTHQARNDGCLSGYAR